jgi:hypothetical protein
MSHVLWGWVASSSWRVPLVVVRGGLNFFGTGQFAHQLLRLVNESRQALGANPRSLACVPQSNQRNFRFGTAAIEAVLGRGIVIHNFLVS